MPGQQLSCLGRPHPELGCLDGRRPSGASVAGLFAGTKLTMTWTRSPAGDHWESTVPAADRRDYAAAWQEHRACRDCRHWSCSPQQVIGTCGLVVLATFLTPEDYTCAEFEEDIV